MDFQVLYQAGVRAYNTGHWAEAQELLLTALESGDGSPREEADCLRRLGGAYQLNWWLAEAESSYREALVRYREFEDTEPEQSACLHNLSTIYRQREPVREAEAILRAAVEYDEVSHGPDHEQTD